MIRGSDGLEYADEAALLLREPLDNTFNGNVQSYRQNVRSAAEAARLGVRVGPGAWTEEKVRQYIEGFTSVCPEGDPGPSRAFADAHGAGLEAAGFRSIRQEVADASQRLAEYIDQACYDALVGKSPTLAITDGL